MGERGGEWGDVRSGRGLGRGRRGVWSPLLM